MPDGKFPMSGPALPTIPVQLTPTFNTHSPQTVSIDFGAKPSAVVPDFGNVDIFKGQFVQQMGLGGSQFGGKSGFAGSGVGKFGGVEYPKLTIGGVTGGEFQRFGKGKGGGFSFDLPSFSGKEG